MCLAWEIATATTVAHQLISRGGRQTKMRQHHVKQETYARFVQEIQKICMIVDKRPTTQLKRPTIAFMP